EHSLKVVRQRAREFHSPFLRRMCERQTRGVKKRTREMGDGSQIAWNTSMDAAIERVADDRMPDGTQMNANLVRAAGVNRDVRQWQDDAELLRLHDSRDGLAAAPCLRRHLLAIHRIASNRRVDAPAGLYLAPDERDVFLFDLAVAKLSREFFMRRVV